MCRLRTKVNCAARTVSPSCGIWTCCARAATSCDHVQGQAGAEPCRRDRPLDAEPDTGRLVLRGGRETAVPFMAGDGGRTLRKAEPEGQLEQVERYRTSGSHLEMLDAAAVVIARFEAVASGSLPGVRDDREQKNRRAVYGRLPEARSSD